MFVCSKLTQPTPMLIVLSHPENLPHETEAVVSLFEAGMAIFHIRKPHFSLEELRAYLQRLPTEFRPRCVLHQHHALAQEFPLRGIHFTTKTTPTQLDQLPALTYSASLHQLPQLYGLPTFIDYAFLSPIFPSLSKTGYQNPALLAEIRQTALPPSPSLIALGGITPAHIPLCIEAGFAGVAVLGYLWQQFAADGAVEGLVGRYGACCAMDKPKTLGL